MLRPISLLTAATSVLAMASTVSAVPDVVVSDTGVGSNSYYGSVGSVTAYAIYTTSCNIGTNELPWFENDYRHPVIPQNMYRLKDGRFEQIGMSWLKHGWCAADGGACLNVPGGPLVCIPNGSCDWLGIGCTDTYGVSLNAIQTDLGPRSEVNASTGLFPYPYGLGWNQSGNAIYKRLQVLTSDVLPASNPGALYWVEAHYVHPADSALAPNNPPQGFFGPGNPYNNLSYRRITIASTLTPSNVGSTIPVKPAIDAWKVQDAAVALNSVDVPSDGRFQVGSRAYDNGNGTYDYEYAVFNLNSARSAGVFRVNVGSATITNIGFHDVFYHSGEPYDPVPDDLSSPYDTSTYGPVASDDWPAVVSVGTIEWATTPQTTNPNANALRWSTLYNFRFTANAAPAAQPAPVTIGLFRPGTPAEVTVNAYVPGAVTTCACPGDVSGNNTIDSLDIAPFTAQYLGQAPVGPCASDIAPPNGTLDEADLTGLVNLLLQDNPTCP